jgi:Spermine/spermidine synthase domain
LERSETLSPFSREGLQLFLLGFGTLFYELIFIRYLAGNIWNLGYFPNLVLLAVFVGMGIGFLLHHYLTDRHSAITFHAAFYVLFFLVLYVYFKHPSIPVASPGGFSIGGELFFSDKASGGSTSLLPFLIWFVGLIAAFAMISQRTAKVFRLFKPLTAYTLDIAGSCCGILAFMAISFLQIPAFVWFILAAAIFVPTLSESWKVRWIRILPALYLAVIAVGQDGKLISVPDYDGPRQVVWSPYQKIEYADNADDPRLPRRGIWANGIEHQRMMDREALVGAIYSFPFVQRTKRTHLPPYQSALILGAGSGNDAAAALMNGISRVVAVEIDPAIARFGFEDHPLHPYKDPRVELVVNDGRAFMTGTNEKFDLVVFALTDSIVKVSSLSQLRLENYLFTEQSVKRAFELLSENGELFFYNYYREKWVADKIAAMIYRATGLKPYVWAEEMGHFAVMCVGRPELSSDLNGPVPQSPSIATDDWPFLYLRTRAIPGLYVKALVGVAACIALLLIAMQFAGRTQREFSGRRALFLKLAFLLMGTAFLLLETKSIIQFSLLFGTTWLNNSLVFLAVLLLVLAANWTALAIKNRSILKLAFALCIGSALITLAYPLSNLLSVESTLLRFVAASLITFAPIFFANLIFSITFRDQRVPEHLFGWNLIGATIGGLLEYTSMALGYNLLAVIVAGCYCLVFIFLFLAGRRSEPFRT